MRDVPGESPGQFPLLVAVVDPGRSIRPLFW